MARWNQLTRKYLAVNENTSCGSINHTFKQAKTHFVGWSSSLIAFTVPGWTGRSFFLNLFIASSKERQLGELSDASEICSHLAVNCWSGWVGWGELLEKSTSTKALFDTKKTPACFYYFLKLKPLRIPSQLTVMAFFPNCIREQSK